MRVEPGRDFRVGGLRGLAELVGGEVHDAQLHLLVAAAEFGVDFRLGHRDPVGEGALQLLHGDAAPDLLLELVRPQRRVLHVQHLPVARLADELAVLLKRRQRTDAGDDFLVAGRDAQLLRLGERRFFLDHLLDDALVDAELLEQPFVHLAAELIAVRLHLLHVHAAEAGHGNLASVDGGDDVIGARRHAVLRHEAGDVEENECDHDDEQAPFQPVLVPAHPVEHGHGKPSSASAGENQT